MTLPYHALVSQTSMWFTRDMRFSYRVGPLGLLVLAFLALALFYLISIVVGIVITVALLTAIVRALIRADQRRQAAKYRPAHRVR